MASNALWAVSTVEIPHFAPRLWEVQCLRLIVKLKDVTETHAGASLWLGTPERREAPAAGSRVPITAEAPSCRAVRGGTLGHGGQTVPRLPAVHLSLLRHFLFFLLIFIPVLVDFQDVAHYAPPLGPFLALSPPWADGSRLRSDASSH